MKHGGNVWEGGDPAKWLDFSANLRPEGPPEWVQSTLAAALADARYYPDRRMRAAREGLAAYLGVPAENVLPTAGGAAAIDLALGMRAGRVLARRDTFGEYAERARAHGRAAQEMDTPACPGDTAVLCNPNNPTGEALPRAEALALHRRLKERGAELLADEAFIDFCPEHTLRRDVCDTLTVVGSLTKLLCVPGIRLGYAVGAPRVIREMEERAVAWSLNALAAAVAAELPRHKAEIAADIQRNSARRERFSSLLREIGARPLPSRANFLLVDFGRDMSGAAAYLKERGILVRPCASFGLANSFLRLAVKRDGENDILIREIKTWLAH